tara:strand:+ start:245 stop:2536 length:2292 start_codon:yes stop_codon:yes gene_type:complete
MSTASTAATTSGTTSTSVPAGFARRIARALEVRLTDDVVASGTTTTTARGGRTSDEGGDGEATMTATTATTVDLGTCARALSDIVARERDAANRRRASGTRTRGTEDDAPSEKESVTSVNLRAVVERRGLALNESFLDCSMRAQSKLSQVEATLEALDGARDRMRNAVEGSKQKTSALVRESDRARADLDVIKSRRELVNSFAVDFQLTKAHVEALTLADERAGDASATLTATATDADELPPLFFQALERVKVIQGNCAKLANTEQQRAGLELMDVMTSYAEAAHEKLRRWVVAKCRTLAEQDDFITDGDESALRKAVSALRRRPTLFKACVEEVTRTRHNALFRRFITALTRGSAGAKPIEVHAHDPFRYASDMLSWVHQAVAGEKEFCAVVFADDAVVEVGGGEEDADKAFDPARAMLSKVFDAICRPLKVHVEQILASVSGTAESGVMTAYKLANLLPFYRDVLANVLDVDASIAKTVGELSASAKTSFSDAVAHHGIKYRKLSLAPDTLATGDEAYAPPAVLREGVASAIELLEAVATSSKTASGSDVDAAELLAVGVNGLIDPLVVAVDAAAVRMKEQLTSVIGSKSARPKWAGDAFSLNCLLAIREPLRTYPAAGAKVDELSRAIATKVSHVADAEAGKILSASGLSDALELVVLYQEQGFSSGSSVMANDPALKIDALATALSSLVDAVGTDAPEFEQVQSPAVRRDVVARYNSQLVEAYTRVYAAVLNPSAGYGADARSKIRHGPDALSTVLGAS